MVVVSCGKSRVSGGVAGSVVACLEEFAALAVACELFPGCAVARFPVCPSKQGCLAAPIVGARSRG